MPSGPSDSKVSSPSLKVGTHCWVGNTERSQVLLSETQREVKYSVTECTALSRQDVTPVTAELVSFLFFFAVYDSL